ncbi:FAD/FMN-containing dehydrogenase [Mycoavidus cysteinexigens]|uniref:FAD/FMN-containing dehydrogenase n=1 Tax=Mycoavidus cysteinexigens TaxID=1553431 RepID=A0A2Z6EY69_9BURK|nr:ABC transporter substrate-binding protein [Mycoavidus cysteinexigens]BBE10414.1 FAD/FMN-containing dehydrogenase [Mycoavidus cysteinexigens]GAM53212.1 ABC transporter, periplasmic spermidine putrescine-binding protein PotD [bacterium endosymbiont of Mortierella elongata FMR23-6]GLR02378.1 dehydrogenase [Mycoavidus cysteinexigens]
MNHQHQPNEKRRAVIKKMAALSAAVVASPFVITPSRGTEKGSAKQKIIIRTSGGYIQKAYEEILFKPFKQKFGIEVIGIPSNAEPTAEVKAMVETKTYTWNMACLSHRAIQFLGLAYLEPHRLEHDPVVSTIMPQFISPYSVGTNVFTIVLAYRTDAFKARQAPRTWQDFWDVKNFPGRRGLRKSPFDTIEEALMADGVLPNAVYPCDLDRAFHSLDRIKPHISVWYQNAPETEQLLKSSEVDLIPAFTDRVLAAINAGAPVAFSWDQHIYGYDNWTILKGAPNVDACREFIKFASDPRQQALLAPYGIGPTQPDVLNPGYIDLKHAKLLATYPDNLKKGLPSSGLYWKNHQNAVIERYSQWMLS